MAYCTAAQLKARYDQRFVNQLSSDDNSGSYEVLNVTAALDDATADINLAALRGGIYTAAQLEALFDSGDAAIIRLCADLAVEHLAHRRVMGVDPALEQRFKRSRDMLEMLANGKRVFNIAANRGAEQPALVTVTADQIEAIGSLTATEFFGGPQKTQTVNG